VQKFTKLPTVKGAPGNFTGDVWIDAVENGRGLSRARVNLVRFSPGARTAWHSHVLGQSLYVTEGIGYVQTRGESAVAIRVGDVVFTPAGEEHWHGASPDHFMSHYSIVESRADPGSPDTVWGGHVTDEEYSAVEE
jgi:quercetin dioxygenase-like cupin family protein